MGNDVFSIVRDFLEGDRMLKNANHNIISLTLKVKSVKSMKDFRPISLCNVFYKIIAKLLTLRLQPFMGLIMGAKQR